MRSKSAFRPTYKFQAQRQRQIWQAPLPFDSYSGDCLAIAKKQDNTFEVLVERGGRSRWLPVEKTLTEAEVEMWLQQCRAA